MKLLGSHMTQPTGDKNRSSRGPPVLVAYCLAQWSHQIPVVSLPPTASQWGELRSTLPFPSCFLYNAKFLASRLLSLPLAFTLVSCSAYSTLKMEVICSSKTSVEFQWTTRRYISEDSTVHNHCCENLKSYIVYLLFCKTDLLSHPTRIPPMEGIWEQAALENTGSKMEKVTGQSNRGWDGWSMWHPWKEDGRKCTKN
jgi:hypothetical protein